MRCNVEGCDKDSMYKAKQLCQMHYFRLMRTGSTTKEARRKPKVFRADGYTSVYDKDHPLSDSSGYVFEHRLVMWTVLGPDCSLCELCGKKLTWRSCHIDHKNRDRGDNSLGNLRPLCCRCNVWRHARNYCDFPKNEKITIGDVSKTAQEWAREENVKVAGRTILLRRRKGMSDYDAVFSEKITHKYGTTKKTTVKSFADISEDED